MARLLSGKVRSIYQFYRCCAFVERMGEPFPPNLPFKVQFAGDASRGALERSVKRGRTITRNSLAALNRVPSASLRPKGFAAQHIINIRDFYQSQLGRSSGPHLFVDEFRLWGMSPSTNAASTPCHSIAAPSASKC